jgi:nucleoside 2-deoxyribosyltransferase
MTKALASATVKLKYGLAPVTELVYLASPYSRYPYGLERAFKDAVEATGWLMRTGATVYSPIAHSHYIAKAAGLPADDAKAWEAHNTRFMDKCDTLIVCMLQGWDESKGVAHEIGYYQGRKQRIWYLNVNPYILGYSPEDVRDMLRDGEF